MSQPNSVIIYRSRAEQEIDNFLWNGNGEGIVYFGWVIAFLIAFVCVTKGMESIIRTSFGWKYRNRLMNPWILGLISLPLGYGFGKTFGWLIINI